MTSDLMIIILKVGMLKGVPIFNGMYLRRTGYFLPGGGGGGKPFAPKIIASYLNFYKTVEQRRGPMQWLHTVFQGQCLPTLSINYVAINKHLEKLPPQLY